MKRIMLVIMICILSSNAIASVSIETKFVQGKAPIIIDGNLEEWEWIGLDTLKLENYRSLSKDTQFPLSNDLSATFKCFADNANIYCSITVIDDIFISGNHEFGRGWMDDVVEICFDGDRNDITKNNFDINDGQIIVVGDDKGLMWIEGMVPGLVAQIPYYWEARGVRAGFQKIASGYSVEIMIPIDVLDLSSISEGAEIGLNIRVLEDDGNLMGSTEGVLSWAYDPDNTSSWKTECYNRVIFSDSVTVPGRAAKTSFNHTQAMSLGAQELLLNLSDTNSANFKDIIQNVHKKLHDHNWSGAIESLTPLEDCVWAKSMLGTILLHNGNFSNANAWLIDFSENTNDKLAKDWAKKYLVEFAQEVICTDKFSSLFSKKSYAEIACMLNEHIRNYPDDNDALKSLIISLISSKIVNAECIEYLIDLSQTAINQNVKEYTNLAIAKCYLSDEHYQFAKEYAEALLSNSTNEKIKLEANMIIYSINIKAN